MKRLLALTVTLLMLLLCLPALAVEPQASRARTTLLDLSNTTTSTSSAAEGWSFDPTGNNGDPQLTLNSYGLANAHSAPIKLPKNATVVVNGVCYIDNSILSDVHSVIKGGEDGYLRIRGSGTLNLYSETYNARCIDVPIEGENINVKFLYIDDVTINCYALERDMYNANTLEACIYAGGSITITNATINTRFGGYGIKTYGFTPIGGTTDETANPITIDNSTINIQNNSDNELWNYAKGINTTFGKVIIKGNSDVTINAGSQSIYSYHSLNIEGGSVRILSTPVSTADIGALVYCSKLRIKEGASSFYVSTTKYPLTKVLYCKEPNSSTLGNGLTCLIGSFAGGDYSPASDPNNNNLPALHVVSANNSHTVTFCGFGGAVVGTVTVPHGGAASAPSVPRIIDNENGSYVFYGWDAPLTGITSDIQINAVYLLIGDADHNDEVTASDALLVLRCSMELQALDDMAEYCCDIDRSGDLTASDALLILRYTMELIDSLAMNF